MTSYRYDAAYQLEQEQRVGVSAYSTTYVYDGAGNRLTKNEGGVLTSYTYDAANQLRLERRGSGVTTHTYDANGNLRSENVGGALTTYSWDVENRLTVVAEATGGSSRLTRLPAPSKA